MILVVLALCLVMAGCGAVGEPLPPLLDIPVASKGVTAVQRGEQIQIAWPPPTLTTEGAGIRPGRQGQTKVYRAVLDGLRAPDKVSMADLATAQEAARIDGKLATFTDRVDPAWAG